MAFAPRQALASFLCACLILGPAAASAASVEGGSVEAAPAPGLSALSLRLFLSSDAGLALRQDPFWTQAAALASSRGPGQVMADPLLKAMPPELPALVQAALASGEPAAGARAQAVLARAREDATRSALSEWSSLHERLAKALESGTASELAALTRALGAARFYCPEQAGPDLKAARKRLQQLRMSRIARDLSDSEQDEPEAPPAPEPAVPVSAAPSPALAPPSEAPQANPPVPPPAPAARSGLLGRAKGLISAISAMCRGDETVREFTAGKKKQLALARLIRLGDVVLALGLGWGMGAIIDVADKGYHAPAMLVPFLGVAAGLIVTRAVELVSDLFYMTMVGSLEYDLIRDFRVDLFKRFFSFRPAFFRPKENDPQALANRLSDDVSSLATTGVDTPLNTPFHIAQSAASLAIIIWTNLAAFLPGGHIVFAARAATWLGTGILIAIMILHGLVSAKSADKMEALEEAYQSIRSDMMSSAQTAVADREIYMGMGIEDHPIARFESKASELAELGKKQIKVDRRNSFQQRMLGLLSTDLLIPLAVCAMLFLTGHPSVGMITALTTYASELSGGVEGLADDYTSFKKNLGGSAKIRALRREPLELDAADAVELGPLKGRVEFKDVSFSYQEGGPQVLKGVSFAIEPGESIAFVGPSGAGKSTLFKLLTRIYKPSSGQILVDGVDIASVRAKSLRRQLSLVPQESGLVGGSVRDNLLAVNPSATPVQIESALRDAGILDDVLVKSSARPPSLEDALQADVDDFSGGQRQRIAIARALLRDSNLMMLDEWSSALDQDSESRVAATLARLRKGRTTLAIDHNLRFDKRATRIIVLDDGRVVATGKHGALLKSCPLYAELVKIARDNVGGR